MMLALATVVVLLQCSAAATELDAPSRSSPPAVDHAVAAGTDDAVRVRGSDDAVRVRGTNNAVRGPAARRLARRQRLSRRPVAGTGAPATDAAADGGCEMVYMPAYVIPDGSPVDPCVTCRPRRTTPCRRRAGQCDARTTKRCSCPPTVVTKTPARAAPAAGHAVAKSRRRLSTDGALVHG